MGRKRLKKIYSFDFDPGKVLAGKYEVVSFLGSGWEGEVYRVVELATHIERAAKIFYPRRNRNNRATKFYAKKLHKLRHCSILIQYHTQEKITYRQQPVTLLVSEYVEGKLLPHFLKKQPGKRLTPFEGLHLLHALAVGVEEIHKAREYHGDLHEENVIIRRQGLSFDVKLVDMYNWGPPSAENIREDVFDLIKIFYDSIGGVKHYAKQPQEIKYIICGLKRSLIARKFRTAGQLREYLETMQWQDGW